MAQGRLQFFSQTRRFPLLVYAVYCTVAFHLVLTETCPKEYLVPVEACLTDKEMTTGAIAVTDVAVPNACAGDCFYRSSCVAYSVQPIPAGGVKCYLYNHTNPASSKPCNDNHATHYNMINGKCGDNGIYNSTTGICKCINGYVGDECHRMMTDCREGYESGHYTNTFHIYQIQPATSPTSFSVNCRMYSPGLTLMQRSRAGTINFNRKWGEYRDGFGDGDHYDQWLGLEKIHQLTKRGDKHLLVFVSDDWKIPAIQYNNFTLTSESENYTFTFNGTKDLGLGDCLGDLRGNAFSTPDNDNDGDPDVNCADVDQGGWWYGTNCSQCNLNGYVENTSPHKPGKAYWYPGYKDTNIKYTAMHLI